MGITAVDLRDMEFMDVVYLEKQLYKFLEQEMEAFNNG